MESTDGHIAMRPDQISTLNSLERMGAGLSLIGVSSIFVTFAIFKRMRTIPNTFIFFASIANVGACVACLIGYAGIEAVLVDRHSALCQAQGFLFEWFMQSDPWWSFAMAINVYMVFFMSFNPSTFRQKLWIYCIVCYGVPAIPSFFFLFWNGGVKGRVYGDAALWCWIGSDWNELRIYSYYIPIWLCAFLSAGIYVAVGWHVFHERNQLRNLSLSNPTKDATCDSSDVRDSAEKNLTSNSHSYGTVTTEVQVTSAAAPCSPSPYDPYSSASRPSSHTTHTTHRRMSEATTLPPSPGPLSLNTIASMNRPSTPTPAKMAPVHIHNYPWSREPSTLEDIESARTLVHPFNSSASYGFPSTIPGQAAGGGGSSSFNNSSHHASISAAPPPGIPPCPSTKSTNTNGHRRHRHHHRHPSRHHRHLRLTTPGRWAKTAKAWARFRRKLHNTDPVKLAYLRTSFVFAISVLVTWTPSSINRIYSLRNPAAFNYRLNLAAAVVLPLQGVWNAVIYFSTSWRIVREEWLRLSGRSRAMRRLGLGPAAGGRTGGSGGGGGRGGGAVGSRRSEMGRSRRLDEDEVELRLSPVHSAPQVMSPRSPRIGTVRIIRGKSGLEDDYSLA